MPSSSLKCRVPTEVTKKFNYCKIFIRLLFPIGYYSHEQALEQVTYSVFQYIPVIARPLVLVGADPKSWTHAYTDITVSNKYFIQVKK